MKIREFNISDYLEFKKLLEVTDGVSNREADSFENIKTYLERNPGHSFIALDEERIIGIALCGHDGRRGYLQHVLVIPEFRKRGIAKKLIAKCLDSLEQIGIYKTHIDVFKTNNLGNNYWTKSGWKLRDDIFRYSFNKSENPNI